MPDDDRIQLATGGTTAVDRWNVGKRLCDIKEALDGSLWMLEEAGPGGLYRLTPK